MAQNTMTGMALPNNLFQVRSSDSLSSAAKHQRAARHIHYSVRVSYRPQPRPAPNPSTLITPPSAPRAAAAATDLAQSSLTPTTQELQQDARLRWKARMERVSGEESLRTHEAAQKNWEVCLDESLDILHCLSDNESLRVLEAMELARTNLAIRNDHESLEILERETAKLQRSMGGRQSRRKASSDSSGAETDREDGIICPIPWKAQNVHLSKLELPSLEPEKSVIESSLLESRSQEEVEALIAEAIATTSKKPSGRESNRRSLEVCNSGPETEASIATPSEESSTKERSRWFLIKDTRGGGMTTPVKKAPSAPNGSSPQSLRVRNADPELAVSIPTDPANSLVKTSKNGSSTHVSQVLSHSSEPKSLIIEASTSSRKPATKKSGFWSKIGFGSFISQASQLQDHVAEEVAHTTSQASDELAVVPAPSSPSTHQAVFKDPKTTDHNSEHATAHDFSETSNESKVLHTPSATISRNGNNDLAPQVLEEDTDDDTDSASDFSDETGAMSSPLKRYLATENSLRARRVVDPDAESSDGSEAMSTPSKKPATNESNGQSHQDADQETEDLDWTELEDEHNDWTDLLPESQILFPKLE